MALQDRLYLLFFPFQVCRARVHKAQFNFQIVKHHFFLVNLNPESVIVLSFFSTIITYISLKLYILVGHGLWRYNSVRIESLEVCKLLKN